MSKTPVSENPKWIWKETNCSPCDSRVHEVRGFESLSVCSWKVVCNTGSTLCLLLDLRRNSLSTAQHNAYVLPSELTHPCPLLMLTLRKFCFNLTNTLRKDEVKNFLNKFTGDGEVIAKHLRSTVSRYLRYRKPRTHCNRFVQFCWRTLTNHMTVRESPRP